MKQLKIGGYIRVSTEEQASIVDGSLDNQKYRINAFVDLKNVQESKWGKIEELYIDDGYSAKDTRRPAFQRMLADIKKGKIDLIIVTDISRLSRNTLDFCELLKFLKEKNSSFLSIKEQFDTSTSAGRMMIHVMVTMAEFEREQTAERVALGCHSRAMRGLLNGGHEILGYDKVDEKKGSYVVNEVEAEHVRTAFKVFLTEGTLNRTADKLHVLGIRPKMKRNRKSKIVDRGLWTHQTLGDLLKNLAYIGLKEVNKANKNVDAKALKPHQQYQVVKASWSGIVDRMTFDSVQKVLEENKAFERRRLHGAEKRVFIASGIIKCKECGRALVGQSAHGQKQVHRYYTHAMSKGDEINCSIKRIRADEIEQAVTNHVVNVLKDGNYLQGVAARILQKDESSQKNLELERQRLKKELKATETEMDQAFKFHSTAPVDSESARFMFEKIEKLEKKKSNLNTELNENEESFSNVISLDEVRSDLENRVQMVTRGWNKLNMVQQKRALRRLVMEMRVGPGVIDMFYYSKASGDECPSGWVHEESRNHAQGHYLKSYGNLFKKSKWEVQNCLSASLVITRGIEPPTPSLGN